MEADVVLARQYSAVAMTSVYFTVHFPLPMIASEN